GHGERAGAARGASVRAGVESHEHVREAHGAEGGGGEHGEGGEQRVPVVAQVEQGPVPLFAAGDAAAVHGGHGGVFGEDEGLVGVDAYFTGAEHGFGAVGGAHGDRFGEGEGGVHLEFDRGVFGEVGEFHGVDGFVADVGADDDEQPQRGDDEQQELDEELEGLHVGGGAHAAEGEGGADDDACDDDPHPVGQVADHAEHESGGAELRHEVEGADDEHDDCAEAAQAGGGESCFGEVGHGERAGAAHGCGDEDEHCDVSGGESDGIPQRTHPVADDEPGDAEEGGRGQVFPGDCGGVEQRGDAAGRYEEVGGGAHGSHPVQSDQ